MVVALAAACVGCSSSSGTLAVPATSSAHVATTAAAAPTTAPVPPTTAAPASPAPPAVSSAPAASRPPSADAPVDGQALVDGADGYALTVPSTWRRIRSRAELQDLVSGASPSPGLRSALDAVQRTFAAGATIVAFDTMASDGFADNVNVIVNAAAGQDPASINQGLGPATSALRGQGAMVTGHQSITVSGQPALRLDYTLPLGGQKNYGTQVYLFHRDKVFITTVSRGRPGGSLAEQVVASIRLS